MLHLAQELWQILTTRSLATCTTDLIVKLSKLVVGQCPPPEHSQCLVLVHC